MKRRNPIVGNDVVVGIDVDDVLAECIAGAARRWFEETGEYFDPYDVTGWVGSEAGFTKYFSDPTFVANQKVNPGAQRFVRELIKRGCDVMVVTAVPMCVAAERANWVLKNFPEIKPENILIGKRKDVVAVDIMIDDAAHNILSSPAKYPILVRKPWNKHVTGLMAANDFDELLHLVDTIMRQNGYSEDIYPKANAICLVGPSGSGKTEVIRAMQDCGYQVPAIYTTSNNKEPYYRKRTRKKFEEEKDHNFFAETTCYAGEYYGIRMQDMVHHMSNAATRLVIPIDVCGANALRRIYGERVKTVYLKRQRSELVANILTKDIDDEEKVMRILALDAEERNEELCDYSIAFTTVADVIRKMNNI